MSPLYDGPQLDRLSEVGGNFLISTIGANHSTHAADRFRAIKWLRTRDCYDASQPELCLNTYFALSLLDHSLSHMVDRYSRDFLLERLEHETENMPTFGVFGSLSLGPEQRNCVQRSELVPTHELVTGKHRNH